MPDDLDIEKPQLLIEYLREIRRIGTVETPKVRVLVGGVSNRTVLVERDTGEAWVLKQALHKLRVQADWFCDPARVDREAAGLRWLPELAPPGTVTPLVFEDPLNHLLAMQAVPQPHENWKTLLLAGRVEADHVRQFAELLASVHSRSVERAAELMPVFADRCYFESLRLEPYYAYTATQVPQAAEFLAKLGDDTMARAQCLVHGDYSPKNVLVHEGRLVLLDHEVIHWGDPAFDVGFAMAHFLGKAHHLAEHRTTFVEAAKGFWRTYYADVGGAGFDAGLEPMAVRHSLGCSLARVAGRSPLEYLGAEERDRQRAAVVESMRDPPAGVEAMIDSFVAAVGK